MVVKVLPGEVNEVEVLMVMVHCCNVLVVVVVLLLFQGCCRCLRRTSAARSRR